jgi:predicted esterase
MHFINKLTRTLTWAFLLASVQAGELVIKDKQGMDCHVYIPDPIDQQRTYQLLVGVHGAGGRGNGAAGLKSWIQRGDVIVIGPSFETKGASPYQSGNGIHAEKLIDLFTSLQKDYKLNDTMFLHGFSGGSQFVHRFAMLHPKWVCGVSAHSGGSWATDNFGQIDTKARHIPFALSCGEKDTSFSFEGAPFNRLDWFKRFHKEMENKKFTFIATVIPNVGHSISEPAWDSMRQCFQIATGLPGLSATEKIEISDQWKNLEKKSVKASDLPQRVNKEEKQETQEKKTAFSGVEFDRTIEVAFEKANAEKIADKLLVNFMQQYPPIHWKDKPGAENLLNQCKAAATLWRKLAKEKGKWNDTLKDQFSLFTAGLDLEDTE